MKRFFSYLRNHYSDITKILLFLLSVVLLVMVFPKEGKFKYEFSKGKPWMHDDLIAPFDFAILKSDEELEKEKSEVLKELKPYFRRDLSAEAKQKDQLLSDFAKRWKTKYPDDDLENKKYLQNKNLASQLFDTLMQKGILENIDIVDDRTGGKTIYLIIDNVVSERLASGFLTIGDVDAYMDRFIPQKKIFEPAFVKSVIKSNLIRNLRYDNETTEKEKSSTRKYISYKGNGSKR